jgi:hypothetical protein
MRTTVAHRGELGRRARFQIFAGLNMQFPIGK